MINNENNEKKLIFILRIISVILYLIMFRYVYVTYELNVFIMMILMLIYTTICCNIIYDDFD